MQNVLMFIVLVPVAAAILLLFIPSKAPDVARGVALLGSLISLAFGVAAYIAFNRSAGGFQFLSGFRWFSVHDAYSTTPLHVNFQFGVDGIALPLVLLVGVVSVLAVIRSFRVDHRIKAHYFWMLLLIAGLYGVFASADIFPFFFFLELTLVASYFLINIWGNEKRHQAAMKFLIYRGLASVVLLAALIGLAYNMASAAELAAGTAFIPWAPNVFTLSIPHLLFEVSRIHLPVATQDGLFLVFLLAVLVEEALFPFHTWLPTTHEQSDTGTNMLIGGALMKVGLYVLLRFAAEMLPKGLQTYSLLLGILGVISILYGAFVAVAAKDWRRLIAYSSISHMGLVLLAVASMQALGFQGAVFILVSSGLLTALMFYTVGAQADRTKTFEIGKLGGLSKPLPVISGVMLFAALGTVGLPGLSGFIAEFTAFVGAFGTHPVLAIIATAGMILAALYLLFAMQRTTFGGTRSEYVGLKDARAIEYVPLVVLTALVVLVGVYPDVLGTVVHGVAQSMAAKMGVELR
ncbi:MAG: NADH-quinone oxidoreductase subunit M [Firmicutes bacterium]|nr:NADH-quinone oxidoreductase subunit M [Bacillota bacterium]